MGAAQRTVSDGDTIRVYANLLQIPVLILSQKHDPPGPIDTSSFLVQLGNTPPFKPRVVRLEGDDPITIAVLLDGSRRDALLPLVHDGLPEMASQQLGPRDRVAVYAMDGCKLRRFSTLSPAAGATVRDNIESAIAFPPQDLSTRGTGKCERPVGLWDSMDYLTRTLAGEPGRRVVLAVTNGVDFVSQATPESLRRSANRNGVTIFAVAERYKVPLLGPVFPRTNAGWQVTSWLTAITEGSGGLVISTTRNNLPYSFKRFVELLRGRYIVEFSRPEGLNPGTSTINIYCGWPHAFIRPAGTSVPVADPVARDPGVAHGVSSDITDQAVPVEAPGPIR